MNHKGSVELLTKRLLLRPFRMEDAYAMYENWASDEEVVKYLRWPAHQDVTISQKVLSQWTSHYHEPDYYQWAIELRESHQIIGSISVVSKNEEVGMVHIGYCIGRAWWHQGYTSEALERLITFFFEDVQVNRIESQHDPNNPNSGRVMAHCGMKKEGIHRQADISNQGIEDACMYAILASDVRK